MKSVVYLCSYQNNIMQYLEEIQAQKNDIEDFAAEKNIEILDFRTEERGAKDDLKPVLLNILTDFYGIAKKIIVFNQKALSRNDEFLSWITNEAERAGFELVFVEKDTNSESYAKAMRLKDKIKNIPSLPEVVIRVMQLVRDDMSSASALAKVISHDSALSAKVLKLVNSAYYGFSKQITTIQHAITILGFTTIKGLVVSSGIYKMFAPRKGVGSQFDYEVFWRHNILCAIGSKYLAELLHFEHAEDIFSAAILHELGKLILAQYDSENYFKALDAISDNTDYENVLAQETRFCKTNHCEVAFVAATSWNLPQLICDVILYHHAPEKCEKNKFSCIIVSIANKLSNLIIYDKPLDMAIFNQDLIEGLISDKQIYNVYEKMLEETDNLKDIENFFNT